MYYQYIVPNTFYELKYNVTIYDQYFYDALVATIYPFTIYSYTIFPAPTIIIPSYFSQSDKRRNQGSRSGVATLFTRRAIFENNFRPRAALFNLLIISLILGLISFIT